MESAVLFDRGKRKDIRSLMCKRQCYFLKEIPDINWPVSHKMLLQAEGTLSLCMLN
jgi:hypothetical protein